ncbi:DoxX family membrane protein [Calothrix sp. CCY 0018]|uniref:DoxX family membrane protein n=1 Tax=Calothrix sp. CCY 0018 TaxID=3103864 RepID=UPI0039C6AF97
MTDERKLQTSLAIIRISTAMFFLVWSLRKIIQPESTQGIFSKFYMMEVSPVFSYVAGAIQTLFVIAFLVGLFKTWTYGAILGMHIVSVLSTYKQLFNPYESPNTLFWAAVPALGGLIALFLLRDKDEFLTVKMGKQLSVNSEQ